MEDNNDRLARLVENLDSRLKTEVEARTLSQHERDRLLKSQDLGRKKAASSVQYWKEKFGEELGYLRKWAESMETDPQQSESYARL